MPFLDEIATRLVAEGVGVVDTNIFLSRKAVIPSGVGPYLSIVETGGTGPRRTQNNTATECPTASLMARATSYLVAREMLVRAYNALGGADGLWNVTLNGVQYLSITARQVPTDSGLDEAGRATCVFNIDAEKEPS